MSTATNMTTETPIKKNPARSEVNISDTWDLTKLAVSDEAWEQDFAEYSIAIARYASFKGTLATSPQAMLDCLEFDSHMNQSAERLGSYAFLKTAQDQSDSLYQRMMGRFNNVAMKADEASSYIQPELLAIPVEQFQTLIQDPLLELHRLALERLLRYQQYTLGEKEEALLAMQGEMANASSQIFRQLLDSDLKFGSVVNEQGVESELTSSTLMQFLISPDRNVRQTAFRKFYAQFQSHENTLAATLAGSVQKDVYYARARGYDSSLHAALYHDNVPQTVYDSLIAAVRQNLPSMYKFYELRRRKMKLDQIHHYDTYVPILSDIKVEHSWDEAVDVICQSLQPLGGDYVQTLRQGLVGRWCDRYPNQGKQSGAFSAGTFTGDPYILMNFQPKVLNDVFTLTHEAGHSMHSFYSTNHQPFEYYNYTIFVAEVASTFNEQLLTRHLIKNAKDDRFRAYLINNEIDSIRQTIVRQTMFAEFEMKIHQLAEAGEPLTVDRLKTTYGELITDYFGPDFQIDGELKLEGLRIPHFYRAFYVYQYATGLSAAIALSQRVLNGGQLELDAYLGFLKSGCSKYPLDLLRDAGVDLEQPQVVDTALRRFAELVDELEQLL